MTKEEAMRRVGANLKRARKNKGLTQEDLALLIPGQSKPQISAYENGKRDVPQDKIEQFAKVLEISPIVLIPFEEEWNKEAQEFADGMYEREQMLLKYLSEYFEDDEEKYIASRIVQFLPMLNLDGLKEAENLLEEMGEIKKYKRFPDLL